MEQVFADFKQLLLEDARLHYVKSGGGVVIAKSKDVVPLQEKTPYIWLADGGTNDISHLSSHRRWMGFILEVHPCQRIFDKEGIFQGTSNDIGIEAFAKDVRNVMDMQRKSGRYARVFLRGEGPASSIVEGNVHLLEKTLTFEVVRIE